jgi:hypothetical protein
MRPAAVAAIALLAPVGCGGPSDKEKVENAIRQRLSDRGVHSASCHHVDGRRWRCSLLVDHRRPEECIVVVRAEADEVATYRCRS